MADPPLVLLNLISDTSACFIKLAVPPPLPLFGAGENLAVISILFAITSAFFASVSTKLCSCIIKISYVENLNFLSVCLNFALFANPSAFQLMLSILWPSPAQVA